MSFQWVEYMVLAASLFKLLIHSKIYFRLLRISFHSLKIWFKNFLLILQYMKWKIFEDMLWTIYGSP